MAEANGSDGALRTLEEATDKNNLIVLLGDLAFAPDPAGKLPPAALDELKKTSADSPFFIVTSSGEVYKPSEMISEREVLAYGTKFLSTRLNMRGLNSKELQELFENLDAMQEQTYALAEKGVGWFVNFSDNSFEIYTCMQTGEYILRKPFNKKNGLLYKFPSVKIGNQVLFNDREPFIRRNICFLEDYLHPSFGKVVKGENSICAGHPVSLQCENFDKLPFAEQAFRYLQAAVTVVKNSYRSEDYLPLEKIDNKDYAKFRIKPKDVGDTPITNINVMVRDEVL